MNINPNFVNTDYLKSADLLRSVDGSRSGTCDAPSKVQINPLGNKASNRLSPQFVREQIPRPTAYYAVAPESTRDTHNAVLRSVSGFADPTRRLPFQTYSNGFMIAPSYHDKEVRGCKKIHSKLSKVAARYKNILSHQKRLTSLGQRDDLTTGLDASQDDSYYDDEDSYLNDFGPTYQLFDGVQNPLVL